MVATPPSTNKIHRRKREKIYCQFNKLTSVFLCVCPVIDHEFRHNIFKVAVNPRGDSLVGPQKGRTIGTSFFLTV